MIPRASTPADLALVLSPSVVEPVSWVSPDMYRDELAQRRYRPEWTWVVRDGARILARAVWWGRADDDQPLTLDCLWVDPRVPDPATLGSQLLAAGHDAFGKQPSYQIKLGNGWRDDTAAAAAVTWRRAAATGAGLTHQVERLQFEWTPADGTPEPSQRLTFVPELDNKVFVDVFRRVAAGSLDAETRKNVAALGPDAAARRELSFYLDAPGERDWWRLARTPSGQLAGFTIPSATPYGPNVGFLGVLPEMRGHGYIDDILAETTRSHARRGAIRVTATTDAGNGPMAAAFTRAGYRNIETRLTLSA